MIKIRELSRFTVISKEALEEAERDWFAIMGITKDEWLKNEIEKLLKIFDRQIVS